ncbi:conserved hypothetical protein [Leishmania mexicana MHOM/GT/2001/U1103]|uniref:Uncharacterized protein n=1 Tax=Leishmania mexicana (strain MHOM/GT/2001/U1103) TaxID=929439 RepID=E9AYU6_LEIMU|nr:conserved hypothetical protein [Leishmania mexicana MHOM/GT/2001/U1103]CBZ28139.1 conserved hypothetical protein [Leishmania mexicana MHOM/GT/2001/U1103]
MPFTSSCTQVPLLLPEELRDEVVSGAAEIIVERGSRNRCFLHVYSEEERLAKAEDIADPDDVVRHAHERHLSELRWARGVLWADSRVQRFVRYADHILWPAYESLSKVINVVRQLILCEEGDNATVLKRARDVAVANGILRREATLPGLHPLKETRLEGQAILYDVQQVRKRSRDAWAATMPSVLLRVDEEPVDSVAWIAEVKQTSYTVSDILQLQLATTPLTRLVELLSQPQSSPAAAHSALDASAARKLWRGLLDKHRQWAEYHSLFADVEEACRGWGASEACVARDVHAALTSGSSVQLRTGVHASVLQRLELHILLSPRFRKLDSFAAAEQAAFSAHCPARSWGECVEEGMVRVVALPPTGLTPAKLDTLVRQLFLTPALCDVPLAQCCTVSEARRITADLQVVHVLSTFNPFVVVHGSRVSSGFAGDVPYFRSLQHERDRLVTDRTNEQLRHGLHEAPSRGTSGAADGSVSLPSSSQLPKRAPLRITGEAAVSTFNRALISALAVSPLSRAEIQHHPAMREYRDAVNYEAVLKVALKEHAEFKGRKYQLRD